MSLFVIHPTNLISIFNSKVWLQAPSTVIQSNVQVGVAEYVLILPKNLVAHLWAEAGITIFNVIGMSHCNYYVRLLIDQVWMS